MNGTRRSSSHDFKFKETIKRRRLASRIGRNPSKTESVDTMTGGGEAHLDEVTGREVGASGDREERPRRPKMDEHSRFWFSHSVRPGFPSKPTHSDDRVGGEPEVEQSMPNDGRES